MQFFTQVLRNKRFYIASLIVSSLSLNTLGAISALNTDNANLRSAYTELPQLHLPSLSQQDMKEKKEAEQINEHNSNLKPTDSKNIRIKNLGEVEKLRIMYNCFASHTKNSAEQNKILNANVFNDLEVFSGNKQSLDHHLFGFLDHTESVMGKIELQKMLFSPSADITELQRRQRVIQTLVNDEKLFNSLNDKVKEIKKAETDYIFFLREMEEEAMKFFDIAYFQKGWFSLQRFNKSEPGLETLSLWRTVGSPTLAIAEPFIHLFSYWFIMTSIANFALDQIRANGGIVDPAVAPPSFGRFLRGIGGGIGDFLTTDNLGIGWKILIASPALVYLFFYVRGINSAIDTAKTNSSITNMIHEKMINAAALTANNIYAIGVTALHNEALAHNIPSLQAIKTAYTTIENNDTKELLNTLRTETFKDQPSFFSNRGRVLATFKKMFDIGNSFTGAMKAAGEIDAYLSIAKLYKKFAQNKNAQYCFVDYANNATPYININKLWHPVLNPDRVVTNDIELGASGKASNVILTGPNAGGKSTSLKAITIAIVLAQTFGIAPASSMTMTPFALINTYLNIADSEGKESLFQAEMRRAQNLLTAVKNLHHSEFSFVIMDEIFTGTNPKEGMAGAYGVAKKLSSHPNNMSIIATHFQVLTDLEKDTKNLFVNKKVSVIKNGNRITYPYKLENGISDQAIALELLQAEGFDNEILQDAYNVLHNKPQAR